MIKQNKLEGVWAVGQSVCQVDAHTHVGMDDFDNATLAGVVSSPDCKTVRLMVSRVGMHSLYYVTHGRRIYWGEQEWPLRQKFDKYGIKKVPRQLGAGQILEFDGATVQEVYQAPPEQVVVRKGYRLGEAIQELRGLVIDAATELWKTTGELKATCLLSAGTDSTLSTIALMEAGADVHAVSVGTSPDSFDPYHARLYAEQLGIPFTFLQLPTSDAALHALAMRAIRTTEQCEMSNTMMAICTTMVADWAKANDRPLLWHGHYADELLGFSNVIFGGYRKRLKAEGGDPDELWSRHRMSLYQTVTPNDTQVAKVSRQDTVWRSIFYHPDVRRMVWAMPLDVVPSRGSKPLFGGVCDLYVKDGAWHSKKKVGYYTGSGIGTVRRQSEVLQDANLRRIYRTTRAEFVK